MNPIRIAKSWISYRRTLNELGNLSNQTLADIGVSRYDIRGIASRSFREESERTIPQDGAIRRRFRF